MPSIFNTYSRRQILRVASFLIGFVASNSFLPIRVLAARGLMKEQMALDNQMEAPPVRKYKILLLIEDPHNRELVKDYLEFKGYEAITAETSTEALDFLKQELPDLILNDANISGHINSCYTFLNIIKQDARTSWIPFILSTGVTFRSDQIRAFNFGADALFIKPSSLNYLATQIEFLLTKV